METETRNQRVAAALEKQLENCQSVLADCLGHIQKNGHWGEWELRNMLGLMKMSAQLGAVIGRLEPSASSKNRESCNSKAILYLTDLGTRPISLGIEGYGHGQRISGQAVSR